MTIVYICAYVFCEQCPQWLYKALSVCRKSFSYRDFTNVLCIGELQSLICIEVYNISYVKGLHKAPSCLQSFLCIKALQMFLCIGAFYSLLCIVASKVSSP